MSPPSLVTREILQIMLFVRPTRGRTYKVSYFQLKLRIQLSILYIPSSSCHAMYPGWRWPAPAARHTAPPAAAVARVSSLL